MPQIAEILGPILTDKGSATKKAYWQALCEERIERWYAPSRQSAEPVRATTDKLPDNFAYLGLIDVLFPGAKIIHIKRDMRDVGLSLYTALLTKAQPYATALEHIADFFQYYSEAMTYWQDCLDRPIFEIAYEDLVTDIEAGARALIEHCDLHWSDNCLSFHENNRPVLTLSAAQVRKPIYKTSIGRWRHFEKHLQPLLEALPQDYGKVTTKP